MADDQKAEEEGAGSVRDTSADQLTTLTELAARRTAMPNYSGNTDQFSDVDSEDFEDDSYLRIHVSLSSGETVWVTIRREATVSEMRRVIATHIRCSPSQVLMRVADEVVHDNAARVAELPTGALQVVLAHPPRLATGTGSKGVRVYDMAVGQEENCYGDDGHINCVAWDPEGTRLAMANQAGTARIFDTARDTDETIYELHLPIFSLVWSHDGGRIAVGGDDFTARIYDLHERREIHKFQHPLTVHSVAFSPDATRIATGCGDDHARVWSVSSRAEDLCISHGMPVLSVGWNPQNTKLATGCATGNCRVFDIANGEHEEFRFVHGGAVNSVVWDPTGTLLATGSNDGFLRVFDLRTGEIEHKFQHYGHVHCVAWNGDGKKVATGSSDGIARTFDLTEDEEEIRLDHGRFVYSVAFAPNGKFLEHHDYGIPGFDTKVDETLYRDETDLGRGQLGRLPLNTFSPPELVCNGGVFVMPGAPSPSFSHQIELEPAR
jgi:WD40 repeat protein